MSLSYDRVESANEPSSGAAGGEPSPFASGEREPNAAARKVVSLRLPLAPQLAPAVLPAPPGAAGRRPTGPELLAEDEVLKRLLARHLPDPPPIAARPTRDGIGLALGMVARLMVAGCAAAAIVLLLVGIVPLPLRLSAPHIGQTAAPIAPPPPITVAAADSIPAPPPAIPEPPSAAAAPLPATPVATVTVRAAAAAPAAPAAPPDRWALDAGEIERLVKRGEDYLAQGDIAAARLILGRAAAARDPRAALSLGATYDPAVLRKLHVLGFKPDVAQARAWYEMAAGYGSNEAAARLAALPGVDR